MDQEVLAALARWPNVPAVFGWLQLSARGQWRIQGEPILNTAVTNFIGRNYEADEQGRWYFQNGPQRVYVELEITPWVYRLHPHENHWTTVTHTGTKPQKLLSAALLDAGQFLLETELGAGVVEDRDTALVLQTVVDKNSQQLTEQHISNALEARPPATPALFLSARRLNLTGDPVPLQRLDAASLAARFKFVACPAPRGD